MNDNSVPSNYTPLPSASRRQGPPLAQISHDRLRADRVTGWLRLCITAIEPVRIGTGTLFPGTKGTQRELLQDLVLRRGAPVLPGSSLKGWARSVFEALAGGCGLEGSCLPPCVACALFGFVQDRSHFAGRIGVEDALALGWKDSGLRRHLLPRAFQPRRPEGRRIYGRAAAGVERTVPVLVAPPGTRFRTRLHVENVSPAELGTVLLALGLDRSFNPRLGGGKFGGLGEVRFEVDMARIRERGWAAPPTKVEGEAAAALAQGWVQQAELGTGGEAALKVLRATLGAR